MNPLVSIIFPAKNEGVNVISTLNSLFFTKTNTPFEVIIVNDGSTDGSCDFLHSYDQKERITLLQTDGIGAANARNLGAQHANGEYLIFCDAHLQFEDWWIDNLLKPILASHTDVVTPGIADQTNPHIIGYGQTLNSNLEAVWNEKQASLFETAIIPGGCFAISKETFNEVGGFETGFRTWGLEDIEFSIKLWLFGYNCHVEPNIIILHLFRNKHPYKVSINDIFFNKLRMAYSHFNRERIEKFKQLIKNRRLNRIEAQVFKSGVLAQRELYFNRRKYDDDWYFKKFSINF